MNLRVALPFVATMLLALTQPLFSQSTNRWRVFSRTDGLADNACVSVTLGASGNVLVRHLKSPDISILDGYEVNTVPGPGLNRKRVYESPGGQLWSVSPDGLEEFREHLGGALTITLLKGIGQGFEAHEMSLPKVIESIYELQARNAQRAQKLARAIG